MTAPFRALAIQHEQSAPGGYLSQWLDERGATTDVLRMDLDAATVDARDYDLVVSLGSALSAFDDSVAWIDREINLFRAATAAGVPVLGVCFGAQLLARVLGGRAFSSDRSEIGWFQIRTRDPSLVPEGPWFQWHYDTFAPPPGASLVAESPAGPQAFTAGRSLGVQFHPEVTQEIVEGWVRDSARDLDRDGIDLDGLLAETAIRVEEARAAAWRLFDAFLDRVAGLAEDVRGR
jgi:GMP synthase-like glutamine amidotransferase